LLSVPVSFVPSSWLYAWDSPSPIAGSWYYDFPSSSLNNPHEIDNQCLRATCLNALFQAGKHPDGIVVLTVRAHWLAQLFQPQPSLTDDTKHASLTIFSGIIESWTNTYLAIITFQHGHVDNSDALLDLCKSSTAMLIELATNGAWFGIHLSGNKRHNNIFDLQSPSCC
jgi:hypothetical protein